SVRFASRAILAERRAAELRAPDDERLVEETALLEIADERRDRLVRHARVELELAVEVRVLIPGGVVDVDEAHAALDEPPCEDAVPRERRVDSGHVPATALERLLAIDAIHRERRIALRREIDELG